MEFLFLESEIKMPLMKLPVRSTLVKIKDRGILISPIDFTNDQMAQIQAFSPVTEIVAPSGFHHLSVPRAKKVFPDATLWGSPALVEKRSDIKWSKIFGRDEWPYQEDLPALIIEGSPKIAEVVFFGRAQKTLIVTDLCFNLLQAQGLGAFIILNIFGTYRKFAASRLIGRFVKDRAAFQASLKKILAWDFDRIVMGHGEILETNGRSRLENALYEKSYLESDSQ